MALPHQYFMQRCFQLAARGLGSVSPNPLVGAVLVHNDEIIGEGFHAEYGQAHAEVNCFDSVDDRNRQHIPDATLYVNLEPCAHYGKTPPCVNRIIAAGVKKVVIANRDPYAQVNGKGIALLQREAVEVIPGIEEENGRWLNRRFFTSVEKQRPYIILKWAVSADGFIGRPGERTAISNTYFNRMVHRWRTEEDAILIGTNTLINDDPLLTSRNWPGKNPLRAVIDRKLSASSAKLLHDNAAPVFVYNEVKEEIAGTVKYVLLPKTGQLEFIMSHLQANKIGSVLVEGGAALHASLVEQNLYDEIRVLKNETLRLQTGVKAATVKHDLKQVMQQADNIFYQWPTP